MYQRIWTPRVGEKATTVREPGNSHDCYAIAVLEDETLYTVGHMPREIAKECFFFIRRGGVIGVEVTGPRQKSTQPDMGMEIPCTLMFTYGNLQLLEKAKELLGEKGFKAETEEPQGPKSKRLKTEEPQGPKTKKQQKKCPKKK